MKPETLLFRAEAMLREIYAFDLRVGDALNIGLRKDLARVLDMIERYRSPKTHVERKQP